MPTVQIDDAQIAYREEGSGPAVVLLHAFPLSAAMWGREVAELAGRYRVIAPDTRGLGGSALGAARPDMDRYADDVAALLDRLGVGRAAVVGLSMGGYIAFALLRRHPARVGALGLACTRAAADGEDARRGREQSARLAEEQGPAPVAEAMLPRLLSAGAPAALREQVRAMILASGGAGIAAAQRAMAARPDSTALLAGIGVPTLVVGAGEDAVIPMAEARAMQQAIPGARLAELPGAGHLANLEQPEAFGTALAGFLDAAWT